MKHIDKSLRKSEGELIIKEFLQCFLGRKGQYPSDFYKAFCSEIDDIHEHRKFRDRLVDEVLMPEQDNRCCYCLRKLSDGSHTTIEHLMLNNASDKSELDLYRRRATQLDALPHSNEYRTHEKDVDPPHPHSIAYQNMVLSCDGDLWGEGSRPICCNMKKILTGLLMGFVAAAAWAVPAREGTITHRQKDGTQLTLRLVGDEFCPTPASSQLPVVKTCISAFSEPFRAGGC